MKKENNCGGCCDESKCGSPCGCPLRVLSVEAMPDKPGYVKFNLDGGTVLFDFAEVVAGAETDTFLRVDAVARVLKYLAEGHTNNISASQLGSILHVADLGDVNISGVQDNSLFVYQKNSDCGKNCGGIQNQWIGWNSDEHLEDSVETVMGFDDDNAPKALAAPLHTDQHYLLSWRGDDKVGYTQPVEVSVPSVDSNDFSYLLFENPTTKQIESLKVKVNIDSSGNVTFNTQGGKQ